ncbi:FecR domain-containing protein [Chitinophaga sp. YIM B06452]|uniref:FecR family protein n=1 Tax=Chitinophaga sp. YIM B06452 TaxID=3082158 RepID=UPI0031FEF04A
MMDKLTEEERFLLMGKLTGTLTPEEEKALEHLFLSNPHARPAYEELAGSLPAEDVETGFARRKENPSWRNLAAEFRKQQQSPATIRHIPFYKKRWAAAAAITGVLAIAAICWQQFNKHGKTDLAGVPSKPVIELQLANGQVIDLSREEGAINAGAVQLNNNHKVLTYAVGNNNTIPAGMNSLSVPVGLDYQVKLADGSEVWLNSATRLEFPLSFGDRREITIHGEAYVKVTKDAAKPFIVHLPYSTVQVLGTEFNVNTYDSGVVKVALVEGAVNMQAPTGNSRLAPGRQAVYRAGQPITQTAFEARQVLSWRKGLFYFNDASLEEISRVVPRWYGVRVVIDNPAILSRRFSGVINRNHPINVFMEDLKAISHIDAWIDQEGILHFK